MESIRQITDVGTYWNYIVVPNIADYRANRMSLAKAYNVANSLYHLAEWVYEDRHAEIGLALSLPTTFTLGQFRAELERLCPFGHLHDISNSHKHKKISTSRGEPGITRQSLVQITTVTEGDFFGPISSGPIGGGEVIISTSLNLEIGENLSFEQVIESVYAQWDSLRGTVGW